MVQRLVVPALLLASCSPASPASDAGVDAGTDGRIGQCAAGLKPYGPACIPIFDECKDDEVPLLGGGCKKVGVEECEIDGVPGIKGPPDWTCKRIGVVECVAAGGGPGIKGPPDWGCTPIGPPTTCLAGWAKTADGWCEPIVPTDPCPAGTMEVIGQKTCQPIGDCSTSTWGKIATTASTIFVDGSYAGGGSDGSAAKPFVTIGAALAAAKSGAQIAIAAGTYAEDVVIDKAVAVEGRCAAMVKIVGSANATAAAVIKANGTGLRDVTVNGPKAGMVIDKAKSTLVEHAAIVDCGGAGLSVSGAGVVTLRDSVLSGNHEFGVAVMGAQATIERVAVRETKPLADKTSGYGLVARDAAGRATLTVRDSVVAGNRTAGISVRGSTLTVERSAVRDTLPQASDSSGGVGIEAKWSGEPVALLLTDVVVAGNRTAGVSLEGAQATLERAIVRDTQPQASDDTGGAGVVAALSTDSGGASDVTIRASVLRANYQAGLFVSGSTAVVERTLLRDSEPERATGHWGCGMCAAFATKPANVTLTDCVISKNTAAGVHFGGSTGKLERTIVAGTRPYSSSSHEPPYGDGYYGCGVNIIRDVESSLAPSSDVALRDSLVTGNKLYGVTVYNSTATVERTVVRDTSPQVSDGDGGIGLFAVSWSGDRTPAQVFVREALVARNHGAGIQLSGATGTVERTIVRDTRAQISDQRGGAGVVAWVSDALDRSVLEVRDSAMIANTTAGIFAASSDAVIERVRVCDTRPGSVDGTWGLGIWAGMSEGDKLGSTVEIRECVVAKNRAVGIYLAGTDGTVERTIVRDTLPQAADRTAGLGLITTDQPGGRPSTLALRDSVVGRSYAAGIGVFSSTVTAERCRVHDTVLEAASQGWGDAIQVGTAPDATSRVHLDLADSLVDTSVRAGVIFVDAGGSVRRSVFRKGIFAVDLEEAADPDISDNVFEGNVEDRVTWGNKLAPSPPPKMPPPPKL